LKKEGEREGNRRLAYGSLKIYLSWGFTIRTNTNLASREEGCYRMLLGILDCFRVRRGLVAEGRECDEERKGILPGP